jgi:recombination protein RecT
MAIQRTAQAVQTAGDFFNNALQKEKLSNEIRRLLSAGCGLDASRFLMIAERVVKRNPKLLSCTAMSVATSIVESAVLGLELDPVIGQAYLVPFKDSKSGTVICQLIVGYKGYISLANLAGIHVDAHLVFSKDKFGIDHGAPHPVFHIPYIPKKRGEGSGDLLGAYALVTFQDGHQVAEWMPFEDLEKRRMRSRSSQDGPWVTDTMMMYRKCPVRAAGSSRIPLDIGRNLVRAATMEDQREVGLPAALPEASAAAELVLAEPDAVDVTPEAPEAPTGQAQAAPESTQTPGEPPTPTPEPEAPRDGNLDDPPLERTGKITDVKAPRGKGPGYIQIDGTDFGTFDKALLVEWAGQKEAEVHINYREKVKGDKTYLNLVSIERLP